MRRLSRKLRSSALALAALGLACAHEGEVVRDEQNANAATAKAVDAPPPEATAPAAAAASTPSLKTIPDATPSPGADVNPVSPLAAATSAPFPAATTIPVSPAIEAIVNAPDRTKDDRALDAGRKPGETLAFFNLKPGMRVAELGAGRGYTTELLVRAVGPTGTVYAQNPPEFLATFLKTAWPERLARPINAKVVRLDRSLNTPLPDDVRDLDAVISAVLYHDAVWMGVDRAAMNAAVFKALKPGGAYIVIDSSAKPGAGLSEVKTLHRIDEETLRAEVVAAGFRVESESNFLRNPDDARDWNTSPGAAGAKRGTGDRFAIRFVKP